MGALQCVQWVRCDCSNGCAAIVPVSALLHPTRFSVEGGLELLIQKCNERAGNCCTTKAKAAPLAVDADYLQLSTHPLLATCSPHPPTRRNSHTLSPSSLRAPLPSPTTLAITLVIVLCCSPRQVDMAPMAVRAAAWRHVGGMDETMSEVHTCGGCGCVHGACPRSRACSTMQLRRGQAPRRWHGRDHAAHGAVWALGIRA
eukprot:354518-Chlamydomonas_euryale.AAC.5